MTYRVGLTPSAQRDRDRILDWYDTRAPGQSGRFLDEFYGSTRRLEDFPYSGSIVSATARRVSLNVFPYQLWYRVFNEVRFVQIIAVLHHRQDSARFDGRLM